MRKNNIWKEKKWENEKKKKIGQVFGYLVEKNYSFFKKAFLSFAYFIVDTHATPWKAMCHEDLEGGR
jgi:hypothetical protein